MVIDCHTHIVDDTDESLAELLTAADMSCIDKICICSLGREWAEFPSAGHLQQAARDILSACDKYPDRFVGGVYLSTDHTHTSLELLEQCVADGPCRFIKLWISQYVDDPRLSPVIERAIELDTPILAHTWVKATGNMTRESSCFNVPAVAQRYPAMKLWMAHASGRWEEAARVVKPYPNIAMDVSGGEPESGIVECLLRHIPPDRVFFGSDAPCRNVAVQMSKVLSANLDARSRDLILGEAVRGWLHV